MKHRTRTTRSGQGSAAHSPAEEHDPRARIQRELASLPSKARALLARTNVLSAALTAVAVAASLDPGSQAWIATSLIASYPRALSLLMYLGESLEDAQDILQGGIIEVLSQASKFDPSRASVSDPFGAWFRGVLWRARLHHRRARRTARSRTLDLSEAPDPSVPSHEGRTEAADLLRLLELSTTPKLWRAWHSYEIEGHTTPEIAKREGISVKAAEWRIERAREDLDSVVRAAGLEIRTQRRKGGS